MNKIDISIPINKLETMPAGRIIGAYEIIDQYNNKRNALKIKWLETANGSPEYRLSYFAIPKDSEYNWEYCGDSISDW